MIGWNYRTMMGGGWGAFDLFGLLFFIILFFDAILLGIWLWKQIQRRN